MVLQSNVLVKIPDSDLPTLRDIYAKYAPWAPYLPTFITTSLKWKRTEKYADLIQFYSPENSWTKDGTIIVYETFSQHVYVFTLDGECKSLLKGIESIRLDPSVPRMIFYLIHESHIFATEKYLKETYPIQLAFHNHIYSISAEEAKKFTIECPTEYYIKRIDRSAAKQINDMWPNKYEASEDYIGTILEVNGGYGIFLNNSNRMVAWIVRQVIGTMTMLQVDDEFQGKGLGSLVTKVLSKELAEEGHSPTATIALANSSSQKLFAKLGFQKIGFCRYIMATNTKL